MEKKFTPGPWAYYESMSHGLAGGDTTLAVGSDLEVRDHICFLRVGGIGLPQDQVEANARLIAASPKLLWALEWAAAALQLACRSGKSVEESQVMMSHGVSKTVAAILDEADAAIAEAIGVQVQDVETPTPTGVMLEVDGYTCSYEEFLRENKELDFMDQEKVGSLLKGQSVHIGIQEVKRIQ